MITVATVPGLPLTLAERSMAPDVLRVKATFDEYLDVAETCPYPIQYINGEIVSMGPAVDSEAALPHESLVIRIGYLLTMLFDDVEELEVFDSNIKINIEATGDSVNADVSVVRGEPNHLILATGRRSTTTILNPELVVEVLSGSTQWYDLTDKLETYKKVASLRQILFVNQYKPQVISYVRLETPGAWLNITVDSLTESVNVLGADIPLTSIYKKARFDQA